MSTAMQDRLDNARQQAQELHKKIDAARAKNDEAMRAEFATISARARELSATVKELAAQDQADMRQQLSDAAKALHESADHAKTATMEHQARLKEAAQASLGKAQVAVQKLSESIAARRSAAKSDKIPAKV